MEEKNKRMGEIPAPLREREREKNTKMMIFGFNDISNHSEGVSFIFFSLFLLYFPVLSSPLLIRLPEDVWSTPLEVEKRKTRPDTQLPKSRAGEQ